MKNLILILFIYLSNSYFLDAQTKIFEFETKDSLTNPSYFQIIQDKLVSLNYIYKKDTVNKEECEFKYVIYDLKDGTIVEVKDAKLYQQNYCYRPTYVYTQGDDFISISNYQTGFNNRVSLSKFEDGKLNIYLEKQNDYDKRIINDHKRPLRGNTFYKMDYRNNTESPNELIYELFKLSIFEDSLKKELVYSYKTKSQLSKESITFDNDIFFTTLNLYRDIFNDNGTKDSLCRFEIFRINKNTLSLDTLIIENDYNYEIINQIEIEDKVYFLCYRQDKSIKNSFLLDNDATIFVYDIASNAFLKSKDLIFDYNVDISKFYFDKFSEKYYIVGSASTIENPDFNNSFSDYWIAILDNNFNKVNEVVWSETNIERYGENIYNISSDKEGLIVFSGEYDIADFTHSKPGFYKIGREKLTTVNIASNESNFSFSPNPSFDLITINSLTLPYNLEIFDLSGKVIIKKDNINTVNYRLDLHEIINGLYFINVNGKTEKLFIY